MSATAAFAPASQNARTTAAPMRVAPPVTTAVLPFRPRITPPGARDGAMLRRAGGAGPDRRGGRATCPPRLAHDPVERADELDRHLPAGLLAREPDHLLGEVDDPDRLAHVEHVDVTALPDRAGLDDELNRLG